MVGVWLWLLLWAGAVSEELGSGDDSDSDHIPSSISGYLSRFGYLPTGDSESQRTETSLREAIKRLQSFAGLPATGKVDGETQTLLKTKRCGLPDYPSFPEPDLSDPKHPDRRRSGRRKRWVAQGAIWDHTNLTYRIENWTPDLGPNRVRRIILESLKLWADVSALSFQETQDPAADILVRFVSRDHSDGYPFDGPNVVLAHAFFPGAGIGGDAHFDDDETWTDRPVTGYSQEVNLYSVAAHEFGHSLGLAHSNQQNSLMYPYYRHTMRKRKLPCDDTWGIQELYGNGGHPSPDVAMDCDDSLRGFTVATTTTAPVTTPATTPTTTLGPPTPCDSHIQAIARIRNEIFVFKGRYHPPYSSGLKEGWRFFWRFDGEGYLVEDATDLDRFWFGFPEELDHIDAAYERRVGDHDEIVFFSGWQYWVFEANRAKVGYPRPITHLGLPDTVTNIDAAFIWTYNGKTYLFAANEYWRFDEDTNRVQLDYPRKMSVWKGVPAWPDAVFTDHKDNTYFWKGDNVYLFNSFFMAIDKRYPVPVSQFWTHCARAVSPDNVVASASSPALAILASLTILTHCL